MKILGMILLPVCALLGLLMILSGFFGNEGALLVAGAILVGSALIAAHGAGADKVGI